MHLSRRAVLLGVALALGAGPVSAAGNRLGDGAFDAAAAGAGKPKVYVFRAMGGAFATPEMDNLAGKIRARGLDVEIFNYVAWVAPANLAIARFRTEAARTPLVLVGHSAGGDSAIRFANWVKRAGVPVDLIITIDPTRIAGRVPSNVARFVNIYSSANTLGGGDPLPAKDFRGHFASVDLKNYPEVWHLYLPRITGLQDRVVDKIVAVIAPPVAPPSPAKKAKVSAAAKQAPAPGGPAVPIEYAIPRGEPIVLWDSGVAVAAASGETASLLAARFAVPAWAVASINNVAPDRLLPAGKRLIIPQNVGPAAASGR